MNKLIITACVLVLATGCASKEIVPTTPNVRYIDPCAVTLDQNCVDFRHGEINVEQGPELATRNPVMTDRKYAPLRLGREEE